MGHVPLLWAWGEGLLLVGSYLQPQPGGTDQPAGAAAVRPLTVGAPPRSWQRSPPGRRGRTWGCGGAGAPLSRGGRASANGSPRQHAAASPTAGACLSDLPDRREVGCGRRLRYVVAPSDTAT